MWPKEKTLDDFLSALDSLGSPAAPSALKAGKPITIWLPADVKARYDELQQKSGRRFTEVARAALIRLIELAETRARSASAAVDPKGKLKLS